MGYVMAMVVDKKTPASTLYPAKRPDGALSPTIECFNRHWLDPFVRAKYSLLWNTHRPSEIELAGKLQIEHSAYYGHDNRSGGTLRQQPPSTQE